MMQFITEFAGFLNAPFIELLMIAICSTLIASFFYFRVKKIVSTDPIPQLIHFTPKDREKDSISTVGVLTGLYIKNFPVFDLIKNKFIMDAIVWFEFNSSLLPLDLIEKFSFDQSTHILKSEPEIKQRGNYLLAQYNVKVEFSTNLDYKSFPMNNHTLYITLTNDHISPQEMLFISQESLLAWSKKIYTSDWLIVGKTVETGYNEINFDISNDLRVTSHPRVLYSVTLATGLRKTALIFIPIFFMLLLGTFSLILASKQMTGTMLSLSVGSITGLLAYRFVIEKISPNVGYFTLAEHIYTIVLIYNFLTFLIDILYATLSTKLISYLPLLNSGALLIMQIALVVSVYFVLRKHTLARKKRPKLFKGTREKLRISRSKISGYEKKFNLTNLTRYCRVLKEYPSIGNANWINPNYDHFYRSHYNFLAKLKKCFSLFSWSADYFLYLVKDYLASNKECIGKKQAYNIPFDGDSQIIVFGDLHGAFHSLVRNLDQLKKLNLIKDNLELSDNNIYIIFNGNVIDQSPYVLETLTIVLALIHKNPNQVSYVKGNHEDNELWCDYNTYQELKYKLKKYFKRDQHELTKMMDDLFSSLPLAVYACADNGYLCFAHNEANQLEMTPSFVDSYVKNKHQTRFNLDSSLGQEGWVNPFSKTINLNGVSYESDNKKIQPFQLLYPQNGAMTWSLFSSPIKTYQQLLNFTFDTFAIIHTFNDLAKWSLALYCQNSLELSGYQQSYFHLLYGTQLSSLQTIANLDISNEIILGSSLDLTKALSTTSKRIRNGTLLGLTKTNLQDGIKNIPLRAIYLNDSYRPFLTNRNVETLLNVYKTNIIFSPVGTPTVEGLLRLTKEQKIAIFFPYSGALIFRQRELNQFIHYRPSYVREAQSLLKYATDLYRIKRFAIFYQNDLYGKTALEGARTVLKSASHYEWIEISHERNTFVFDTAAQKISDFNPAAIVFFSTYAPSVGLIHKLGINRVAGKFLLGISALTDAFRNYLQTIGLELILSAVVPNIHDENIPIVREFHEALENNLMDARMTAVTFEGFINSSILAMSLENIEPPFTKEKILAELESIRNLNFKGLKLNFNPETRELSNHVWIDTGHGHWVDVSDV
jgi:ABC-type branched-subunit amino acid transport system substrate-binding protein